MVLPWGLSDVPGRCPGGAVLSSKSPCHTYTPRNLELSFLLMEGDRVRVPHLHTPPARPHPDELTPVRRASSISPTWSVFKNVTLVGEGERRKNQSEDAATSDIPASSSSSSSFLHHRRIEDK